nr:Membrane protein [Mycobacterium pseudoshottsii]
MLLDGGLGGAGAGVGGQERSTLCLGARAPALLISRLVSWVDDLWCRAIGAGV